MPCQAMSMVVVHVASGTRDILVFLGRGYGPRLTLSFQRLSFQIKQSLVSRYLTDLPEV